MSQEQIMKLLKKNPRKRWDAQEIAKALKADVNTVRTCMRQMIKYRDVILIKEKRPINHPRHIEIKLINTISLK